MKNDRNFAINVLPRIGVDGTALAAWERSEVFEDYNRATNHDVI